MNILEIDYKITNKGNINKLLYWINLIYENNILYFIIMEIKIILLELNYYNIYIIHCLTNLNLLIFIEYSII